MARDQKLYFLQRTNKSFYIEINTEMKGQNYNAGS